MRRLPLLLLPCLILLGRSSPLQSQPKKNKGEVAEVGGHSLEYWIGVIPLKDQSNTENAIRSVVLFGPERAYTAVPVILDKLKKHGPGTPIDASVRVNGAMAVGLILGSYREAEPKVLKDAVTILKRFLADNQSIIRYRAAEALGRIGTEAKSAIPEVISVVKDPATWETRQAAVVALGQIAYDKTNGPSLAVLNALYGALGDGASKVRLAAIQSLALLGPPRNASLRPGMIAALNPLALKDPEPGVKIWAQMAIMSVSGTVEKERVDFIAKMLHNQDMSARVQSAQALGTIGREAKSAVPGLIANLKDPEPAVVAWAIWALARMETADALGALERVKADPAQSEMIKKLAEEALELITGKKKVAAPR
jgi:HEAT repeat protein